MAMMMGEDFQYVLRILNTNVDGRQKVMYAMCSIKGIGRRLSCLICKKADIDLNKRAGELSNDEVDRIITIVQNPRQFKIPDWFLNRQKDNKDGKYSQVRTRPPRRPVTPPPARASGAGSGARDGGGSGKRGGTDATQRRLLQGLPAGQWVGNAAAGRQRAQQQRRREATAAHRAGLEGEG